MTRSRRTYFLNLYLASHGRQDCRPADRGSLSQKGAGAKRLGGFPARREASLDASASKRNPQSAALRETAADSFLPPFVRFADSLRPRSQTQLAPRFGCKRATGTFTTCRAPAGGIFLLRKGAISRAGYRRGSPDRGRSGNGGVGDALPRRRRGCVPGSCGKRRAGSRLRRENPPLRPSFLILLTPSAVRRSCARAPRPSGRNPTSGRRCTAGRPAGRSSRCRSGRRGWSSPRRSRGI